MALAAPDYFAGAPDVAAGAEKLFKLAGWIRRRCNEITNEADLDVLKAYDLAGLCQLFRQEADRWISAGDILHVRDALRQLTIEASQGNVVQTTTEINTNYKALYDAAGVFVT